MKVSVVIASYRRIENLEKIIAEWLKQTDDVWLCDCGVNLKTDLPVKMARFDPDPGLKAKYAISLITEGELVVKADDDIMPLPGLIEDFVKWYKQLGDCVMGIHGRVFEGTDYYGDTIMYAGHKQKTPKRVDWLGVLTCTSRKYLVMDLKDCITQVDDIFWLNGKFPDAPKYVVPTVNFDNKMPEARDPGRLCANKEMRKFRREYYKKIYLEKYAK